jgi:hypothetical protein
MGQKKRVDLKEKKYAERSFWNATCAVREVESYIST